MKCYPTSLSKNGARSRPQNAEGVSIHISETASASNDFNKDFNLLTAAEVIKTLMWDYVLFEAGALFFLNTIIEWQQGTSHCKSGQQWTRHSAIIQARQVSSLVFGAQRSHARSTFFLVIPYRRNMRSPT